jgi:uncharacterized protein (TIGR01244 family)
MSNLDKIYNFIQITETLGTAGHPTTTQIQDIADAGYQTLINLAPSDVSQAIPNQGELVEAAGMKYIQIPVAWKEPTLEDWDAFVKAMDENKDKKVFVHCQANMRVSAFVMLYRHIKLGVDLEEAQEPMLSIWSPEDNPQWADFIEEVMAKEKA